MEIVVVSLASALGALAMILVSLALCVGAGYGMWRWMAANPINKKRP